MAKIIVTTIHGDKLLVDTNCNFTSSGPTVRVSDTSGTYIGHVQEPIEEIYRRIQEAEFGGLYSRLDLILKNQEKILTLLKHQQKTSE